MSPDRDGVAFVPLSECTPEPVSRRVSDEVPYLSMWVVSRSSRTGSPSHQERKLAEDGSRPFVAPPSSRIEVSEADQTSAPSLPAQMPPATPRPLSQQAASFQSTVPFAGLMYSSAGWLVDSETLKYSRPGCDGSRSPRCWASPCPV